MLRETVASTSEKNFLMRPHRDLVECFRSPEAWEKVTPEDMAAPKQRIDKLPDQLDHEQA